MIRELKSEVSKLRDIIKAEGLEARVAAYGMNCMNIMYMYMYVCICVYNVCIVILCCMIFVGLSIGKGGGGGGGGGHEVTSEQLSALEKLKVFQEIEREREAERERKRERKREVLPSIFVGS